MIKHRPPKAYPVPDNKDLHSCYYWHPKADDDHILKITKSSLSKYTTCPQQYFINYVLGMKEAQNDNMLRGINVHEAVELFYKRVNAEDAEGMSHSNLRPYFKSCFPNPNEISDQDEFHLDEDLHIDRYITVEMDRLMKSDADNFLPTGNEKDIHCLLTIEVDGEPATIHFQGIIDRIFTNPDGSLHIHELKTGLWKDNARKWNTMRKEMAYYVWLLRKADPTAKITHWGWDHTKGLFKSDTENKEVFRHVEPVRVKEIGEMIADIQSLVRTHRQYKGDGDGSMFPLLPPASQYYFCDPWCGLKEFCPRYQLED